MKREALLYEKLDMNKVRCLTCAHRCVIADGNLGTCRTRKNMAGTCYTLIYGVISAESIDPVEKKPLFHFFPGHPIYSVSSVGCSFKCTNCQNYHLSQLDGTNDGYIFDRYKSPEDLVKSIERAGCNLLAFTYNEPLIWLEYIIDVATLAKKKDIKIALVSNGYSTPEAMERLIPLIDAANIDIKAMDDRFYKDVCKAPGVQPVLDTIVRLYKAKKNIEITNLVIPTLNDSEQAIEKLCDWVLSALDDEIPLHFSAYRPMYKMTLPPTTVESLTRARCIARDRGLKHVYIGNVYTRGGEDTTCPGCNAVVIERKGYSITEARLGPGNTCASCGRSLRVEGTVNMMKSRFS